MKRLLFLLCIFSVFNAGNLWAQISAGTSVSRAPQDEAISYLHPKEYIIGGVKISGTQYLDKDVLITISKLVVGNRILVPGEETTNAVHNLWIQGLFDDVALVAEAIKGDSIFFDIQVVERPRLTRIDIEGLNKTQTEEIKKRLNDNAGKIINENLMNTTRGTIQRYLGEKGFLYPSIEISQVKDSTEVNNQILKVQVDRNKKVKIHSIDFTGNEAFSDRRLAKFLKKIKPRYWWNIFPGKFSYDKYEEAKKAMLAKLHERGYRDAVILSDSVSKYNAKGVDIDIEIHEGPQYYFGDIQWAGNAKYSDTVLTAVLGIKKGDIFSEQKLMEKLYGGASQSERDVSALYMNDGYLAFSVDPVQTKVYNDTIDLELRMYEGQQYTVNKVFVTGNDVTNDRVLLREIQTLPGRKFSKDQVMMTLRRINQLKFFDEQKTDVQPHPNHANGTVDMEYLVTEKPSDQVELSGGFGQRQIIGTLGLSFNNFSTRNLFTKGAWKPLPRGDGQMLSLRGQTSGKQYQSYSFSFSDPWLGGKKPIYFGVSAYTSSSNYGINPWTGRRYEGLADEDVQRIKMNGVSVTLGKQLRWPDNFFQISYSANFQQYKLQNWYNFIFDTGTAYNINLTQEISRKSLDAYIYPTSGSHIRFTVQATPPYSLFNNINYPTASKQERYRWTEYHKWKFDSQWFQRITGKLVLKAQAQFGFLGSYSSATGDPAFERFKLGGDGMQGFQFLQGSEIIAMRGYNNGYVIPESTKSDNITTAINSGSPLYAKYQLELRHPVMLNDQASVFVLGFVEAGNTWNNFKEFNPFHVRRSAGVGARVYLPIFGMLGIDYGYGFDPIPMPNNPNFRGEWRQNFTFSITQDIGGFN